MVDPCRTLTENWPWCWMGLPGNKTSKDIMPAMQSDLRDVISKTGIEEAIVVTFSYGVIGIRTIEFLRELNVNVNHVYILSAPLDDVVWKKPFETIFKSFLPGLKELADGVFQKNILEDLRHLKQTTKLTFFLPRNKNGYYDGRIGCSMWVLGKIHLMGTVYYENVTSHSQILTGEHLNLLSTCIRIDSI